MTSKEPLTDTFCSLVSIPSPSGRESQVGRYIKLRLNRLGIRCRFDDTGAKNGSDTGNLVARIRGSGRGCIAFVAHMDTVESGKRPIKPIVSDGTITSDGRSILGVDNKSAVACLIDAADEFLKIKERPDIVLAFTTREENGVMGANYLKIGNASGIFVLDLGGAIGTFIGGTLGYKHYKIDIVGKASHAAAEPEKGKNAIKAACLAVAELSLGKM